MSPNRNVGALRWSGDVSGAPGRGMKRSSAAQTEKILSVSLTMQYFNAEYQCGISKVASWPGTVGPPLTTEEKQETLRGKIHER